MENRSMHTIGNGRSSIVKFILVAVKIITINKAAKEKMKFTEQDNTLEIGKMYLGTYTFFISAAFCIIEPMAMFVDSEKN